MLRLLLITVLAITACPVLLSAQSDDKSRKENKFDQEAWEKATKGIDFKEKKTKERDPIPKKAPNFSFFNSIGKIFQLIAVVIGGLLLVFLVYQLVQKGYLFNKKDRKLKANEALIISNIEENLLDSDVSTPLQKAIENQQFSLAIRLYYLSILQSLSSKGHIQWKKEKTNATYTREIKEPNLQKAFKKTTRIFENIWYGDKEISAEIFQNLEPFFINISKKI